MKGPAGTGGSHPAELRDPRAASGPGGLRRATVAAPGYRRHLAAARRGTGCPDSASYQNDSPAPALPGESQGRRTPRPAAVTGGPAGARRLSRRLGLPLHADLASYRGRRERPGCFCLTRILRLISVPISMAAPSLSRPVAARPPRPRARLPPPPARVPSAARALRAASAGTAPCRAAAAARRDPGAEEEAAEGAGAAGVQGLLRAAPRGTA